MNLNACNRAILLTLTLNLLRSFYNGMQAADGVLAVVGRNLCDDESVLSFLDDTGQGEFNCTRVA